MGECVSVSVAKPLALAGRSPGVKLVAPEFIYGAESFTPSHKQWSFRDILIIKLVLARVDHIMVIFEIYIFRHRL